MPSSPVTDRQDEEIQVSDDLKAKLKEYRDSRRAGRPKKNVEVEKNPYEMRATFVTDSRVIRKLKYISLKETRLHKDIVTEALSRYVEEWEKKNGEITI